MVETAVIEKPRRRITRRSRAAESTEKITIRLPADLLKIIDEQVAYQESTRSAVVTKMLLKAEKERLRFEEEMRLAYLENAEEALQLAEEFAEIDAEGWPDWDEPEEAEQK